MVPVDQWTDNDWIAIGTLVAAIGTVGAFMAGLYILGVQVIDRRRAQARLVSAWLTEIRKDPEPPLVLVVRVENSSAEPAFGVTVRLVYGNSGTFVRDIGVLGPDEATELELVVPGLRPIDPAPDITFIDAAGRHWTRYGKSGKLINGDPYPPFKQDRGAYRSIAEHPTLELGNSFEARRGRRIKKGG
jgi:hypothetical protein